jgi:hypothetical protein
LFNSSIEPQNDLFNFEFFDNTLTLSANVETYGLVLFQGATGVFAAVWVEYIPSTSPAGQAISFAYPEMVSGATLTKAEAGMELPADIQYQGIPNENIYVLMYEKEYPSMASITVPCMPDWGAAWGNESASPSYWLTYEVDESPANTIYVLMSEVGKVDFFTFTQGANKYALVCTRFN